ncbi:hemerythrin domain-containing protein [Faunimonas sp. B44]|uniref:hemerythrin domain-containing protein n=1 Tax=Faunimonas sp. B44 TaxID=3461493 RepID=UPI004044EDFF
MTSGSDPSRLLERAGLPEDLQILLQKYPRVTWADHRNLGALARFWMGRHDMFRELSDALADGAGRYLGGEIDGAGFRRWFAPRIAFFLDQLEGHHQIEDLHYFPLLSAAEGRLSRGFDLLETDHQTIHRALEELGSAWHRLDETLRSGADGRAAGEGMAQTLDGFLSPLRRHLADEEDLIVPVILDRGEGPLGLS